MYDNMEPDAEKSPEQLNAKPTDLRNTNYKLRHNLKPSCHEDYRY